MESLIRSYIAVTSAALVALASTVNAAEITSAPLQPGGPELILISGEIAAGDEERFRDLALRHDEAIVALDSPGGAVVPAIEIGKAIHLKEFVTLVSRKGICTSACALIWLGGSKRVLSQGGRLGFHASYRQENGAAVESGVANAMIGHYLSQLNLPSRAVVFATLAPPNEILWLDESTRDGSGIEYDVLGDAPTDNEQAGAPTTKDKSGAVLPAPITTESVSTPAPKTGLTELDRYPREWLSRRSARNGLDVTTDGKVWINSDVYGDTDDYAVAASDMIGASGPKRKAWVRGYHERNKEVRFRESKQLLHVDCAARTWATELTAHYDADGRMIEQFGPEAWQPAIPGTYADTWLEMLCAE